MTRAFGWSLALLLCGCASNAPVAPGAAGAPGAPSASVAERRPAADACSDEVARLKGLLAAETAERQKLVRAASRREETLRRQLEEMKAIERGILDRDEAKRSQTR